MEERASPEEASRGPGLAAPFGSAAVREAGQGADAGKDEGGERGVVVEGVGV
ncbi:hypothetical protein ACFVJK_42915 [Streptomyces sp. NPDC127172]|uniref:hypothetical protein n=1 Tax=Streptomyces sp. NPDC127172 TaxID=3345382 RepID=UPI003633540F